MYEENPKKGDAMSLLVGFIMVIGGGYLLLESITVNYHFNYSFYSFGNHADLTSGKILFPFMLGIGIIFYNPNSFLGWTIAIASLAGLIFGVIASTQFHLKSMSSLDLIIILSLTVGGIGLMFRGAFKKK